MAIPALIKAKKKVSSKEGYAPGPKVYTPKNTYDTKESQSSSYEGDEDTSLGPKKKKGMVEKVDSGPINPDVMVEKLKKFFDKKKMGTDRIRQYQKSVIEPVDKSKKDIYDPVKSEKLKERLFDEQKKIELRNEMEMRERAKGMKKS